MAGDVAMSFVEQWREQVSASLGAFVQRATDIKDIDLLSGVLPVAVLWPLRERVKQYDGDTADAVRDIVGAGAGRILKLVGAWGDDPVPAARGLAASAAQDVELRAALARLVEYFDATQIFAEQLAKRYASQLGDDTFNITKQIKAALVNIGGVTNINSLTVELQLPPLSKPISGRQRWLLYAIGMIGLVSALLVIYQSTRPLFTPKVRMSGDFNVAVATFGQLTDENHVTASAEASELAESVYRAMNDELKLLTTTAEAHNASFDIQVMSPSQTGKINGATREERARAAQRLASDINADVIVYGNLKSGATGSSFVPEFYLADRKLSDATELVGQYEFGSSIETSADIASNMAARSELRNRLLQRTGAVARFVIGLSYYALERFDDADRYFQQASNSAWQDTDGKEVVFHFLGNTALRLNKLSSAEEFYRRALKLNPEYARARLGDAEVLYQKSRGSCSPGHVSDAAGLQEAERLYLSAGQARFQPALSDIQTKTAYGLGRLYACLSQAEVADRWDAAEHQFKQVIADFDGGNARVKELAAEAHAGLGLVYLPVAGAPDARQHYLHAADEYRTAIELSHHQDRQATFSAQLGYILGRLQEYDQADAAYAKAIELDPGNRDRYAQARLALQKERATLAPPSPTP